MYLEGILNWRWDLASRIDHDRWWAWPFGGISLSWTAGIWAQVDGTHLVNLIAMGAFSLGASGLGLVRLWELNQAKKWKQRQLDEAEIAKKRRMDDIDVKEAERASQARIPITTIIATTVPLPPPPKEQMP